MRTAPNIDQTARQRPVADLGEVAETGGFRPDIQGLRTLAVVLVVLYHANVPWMTGGFIGVDVFFVISGFVIASSLLRESARTGGVDLKAFYGRRVRRLLPAFAVVAIVTLAATNLLLPVGEAQEAATGTAIAAALSAANLFLLNAETGYFDAGDDLNPFLHMWSLGVEEQFYLVAPAMFVVAISLARRTRWTVATVRGSLFAAATIASVVVAVVWVADGRTREAFFNPAARFWEISAGVLLALVGDRVRIPLARTVSAAAVIAIVAAAVGYDDATPFPGINAFVPVTATVILIAARPAGLLGQILSSRGARWVGDRTYGWYLWHWPLIVLTANLISSNPAVLVTAAVVSLVPTAWSYRYLERPVQQSHGLAAGRRRHMQLFVVFAAVLFASVGSRAGATSRWGLEDAALVERTGVAYVNGCHASAGWPVEECTFAVEESIGQILLLGDSHAASVADGVVAAGNALGYDVVVLSYCPLVSGVRFQLACDDYRAAIAPLLDDPRTHLVLAAHRSTRYLSPAVEAPNGEDVPLLDEHDRAVHDHTQALGLWSDGLARTRSELETRGLALVSIDVVPEFRRPFDRTLRVVTPRLEPESITIAQLNERRGDTIAAEHQVLEAGHWIDPARALCNEARCSNAEADGRWLYFDDSHLNRAGALKLEPLFRRELDRLLPSAAR